MSEMQYTLLVDSKSTSELDKKQARKEYIRKYNEENKDKINERRRAKRANLSEAEAVIERRKAADYAIKWRSENKEHVDQYRNSFQKKYREEHKEHIAAIGKIYREKVKSEMTESEREEKRLRDAEKTRKCYVKNPEKYRDIRKRFYSNHRQEEIARSIEYRNKNIEAHKEYRKKYVKENPEIIRLYSRKRRALKENSEGDHTVQDINNLVVLQKNKCALCNTSVKDSYHVDHIVALSKGGSNDKYNLQLLCQTCNQRKHAKDPIEFNQSLGLLI